MTNQEEIKLKKKIKNKKEEQENDLVLKKDDLIKENLIKLLENQIQESEKNILEKELETEKEVISLYNRLNQDINKSKKFSLEKIIIEFLPIIDSIECALNLIKSSQSKEIFEDIFKKLHFTYDLIRKNCELFNIKKINDVNVLFNPSIHQAMSIFYTDEIKPNQIVTIMQPGYILHEFRLLRPAMVVVSKNKK